MEKVVRGNAVRDIYLLTQKRKKTRQVCQRSFEPLREGITVRMK